MKKFFIWALPVFIILAVSGVVILTLNSKAVNKNIYATNFVYNHDNLTLFKSDTPYVFNSTEFTITPSNCTERIIYATNNMDILEINNSTGEIFTKSTGTCTLFAYLKSSATENLSISIDVAVIETNEDSPYKTSVEENFIFNLEDDLVFVEFDTGSKKDKNVVDVVSGNQLIDIASIDDHKITFSLIEKGAVCIEINSPTKKITINIQII